MGSTFYDEIMSTLINNLEQLPKFKKVLSDEGKKSLSIIRYKKSEATYHSCPILCTDFEENEEITCLPCNHCFDSNAIKKWLTEEKSECPICRLELHHNKVENHREPDTQDIEAANSIADINTEVIPIFTDIDAAYTLIESLNRVSNITSNINNINNYRSLLSTNQRVGRVRIISDDDDIQQAIIASLNDLSSSI